MFYAGNGNLLVSFDIKKERDYFCECHRSFIDETSSSARDYPQFEIVKRNPYCAMDDRGVIDEYYSESAHEIRHYSLSTRRIK